MKRKSLWIIVPAGLLLILASGTGWSLPERRVALVIGNAAYKDSPLKNPANDARDMAAALKSLDFEVIHKENADKRTMVTAADEFGQKLRTADVGLFFFAGHGVQIKGINYLIPVGAHVSIEQDVEFEGVDAGRILGQMEAAGNKVNIVLLDACRDNPFARSFRSSSRGLARMDAPKGSVIAFATAPGSTASDGKGRNGVFTQNLLQHMKTPGLKIEDVLKQVRIGVLRDTSDKQVTWDSSSLTGDFYFSLGATTASLPPSTSPGSTPAVAPPPSPSAPGQVPDMDTLIREREMSAKKWAEWQKRMEVEYNKADTYDRNINLKPEEKVRVWEAFLKGFADDNPTGAKDEDLRVKAQYRVTYWQQQIRPTPPPAAPGAAPSTTTASLTPTTPAAPPAPARTINIDAAGIISDANTRLEWYCGPDMNTTWDQARTWAASLKVGGGRWRLPTISELKSIYKKGEGSMNMDPAFRTSAWHIWSSDLDPSGSAKYLYFRSGSEYTAGKDVGRNMRGFAVRSKR
ncbi:MAG: caspase family protein [Thermodesulfobacteriota bacterium]